MLKLIVCSGDLFVLPCMVKNSGSSFCNILNTCKGSCYFGEVGFSHGQQKLIWMFR